MKTHAHLTTLPAGASSANGLDRQDTPTPDQAIAGFLAARDRLRQREQELEAEIVGIRLLLSGDESSLVLPIPVPPTPIPPSAPARALPADPSHSNKGLRQAVIDLVRQRGPLTKDQIVEQLLAQNFQFFGKPKPALDPVLYSSKFQRNGKVFGLAVNP